MTHTQIDTSVSEPHRVETAIDQAETNAGVARASGVLALGNIVSRVLGMARDVVLANLFGASRAVDAYNIALIIPKTLHDLLIAGHVNSAIVPVLSETAAKNGQKALYQLLSVLFSLATVVMAVLILLLQIFAPAAVRLVSSGADVQTQTLAVDLLRLTSPALLFLALFALASGALYAQRAFTLPAFAGAVFNGAVVIGTLLLAPPEQVTPVFHGYWIDWTMMRPASGIIAAAFGWLIGALVQLALQLPGIRLSSIRFTLNWRNAGIRRIARLYAPVMISLVLDTLVRTLSYNFASQTGTGSISYMNWATTLIQFPHGLVGTAISVAILPTLSRQAALLHEEGEHPFKDTLGLGLRLVITLILPATIGLFVMAQPIVGLIFEHGAFTSIDTDITAHALRLYLIGLPFAALDVLLVYAFYARQDTLTPAVIGFFSLLLYLSVTLLLLPTLGLFSLMIADSVKHIAHTCISAILLHRRLRGMGEQRLAMTTAQTGLAALTMGAALALVLPSLQIAIGASTLIREILVVGIGGALAVAIFVGMAILLRIQELRWLYDLVRRRVTQ
ncbi:MAG: murein biosynthesis integral membrane protein MurJ [Anaerolineae bacterium]|nr:murein biosynthesis integral membrane protein MurJ [Anaerolineae bacterium]